MTETFTTIRYGVGDDGLATLTLARPDKRNAMNLEMFDELGRAADLAAGDPTVRALLVAAEGPSFCAGIDLTVFGPDLAAEGRPGFERLIRLAQHPFRVLAAMPKPVVAAVRGHALGAGFQFALAADLRVVAEGATFGMLEVRLGLVPDLGGTHRLPALVGPSRAKELIWTGRTFDAQEADRLGLVTRLVAADRLDEEARQLAGALAAGPPLPISLAKGLVDRAAQAGHELTMDRERDAQAACLTSEDQPEAVAAHFEKRAGRFRGR